MESEDHVVQLVDDDRMQRHWETYSAMILTGLERSPNRSDNILRVMDALANDEAHIIEIVRDGQILACAVIEMVKRKDHRRWVNVWVMGGSGMDDWLSDFLQHLTGIAVERGAAGVMCGGRVGWERRLAAYGWKREHVLMEKKL